MSKYASGALPMGLTRTANWKAGRKFPQIGGNFPKEVFLMTKTIQRSTGADIDINECFTPSPPTSPRISNVWPWTKYYMGRPGQPRLVQTGGVQCTQWASGQNRGRPPRHALNEGFALNFGWLSHDVLVGQPRIASESADHIRSSTIVWNSQNLEDVAINWTETWTNSTSASLSVSNRMSGLERPSISNASARLGKVKRLAIRLKAPPELRLVSQLSHGQAYSKFNSQNDFTYSMLMVFRVMGMVELAKGSGSHTPSDADFDILTIFHQYLRLLQQPLDQILTGWASRGSQLVWPDRQSQIISSIQRGFNINSMLNNSRGTMALRGRSSDEAFTFRIIRTGRDGRRTVEPLPSPEGKKPIFVRMSEECGAKVPHKVPRVEKVGN
ncbi:hypothetical protein B0H13DRAFT_1919160 [Mycena leptocephala]|nr:hypothetical protein B0H13DRAFT_1919160 [Mycena leptocephala]